MFSKVFGCSSHYAGEWDDGQARADEQRRSIVERGDIFQQERDREKNE
jgi:hypothetical protein